MKLLKSKFMLVPMTLVLIVAFQNCGKKFQMKDRALWSSQGVTPMEYNVDPVLQDKALSLLMTKCADCKGVTAIGTIEDIGDVESMISQRIVIPGRAADSPLVAVLATATLPHAATFSNSEIQDIRNWINSIELVVVDKEFKDISEF